MERWKTVQQIIEMGIVEEIATNIGVRADYKNDFIQDIYMILFELEQDQLQQLIDNKQIKFYLTKIIKNQWFSKTSTFYYKYRKMYEYVDENIDWQEDENGIDDREYTADN